MLGDLSMPDCLRLSSLLRVARLVSFLSRRRCWGGHTMQGGHGARHEPQALGEAQVFLNHRRDVKTGQSEVVRAKWTERSLPPYQSARRPRTKRPHSNRTARASGKRNRDFPDLVVLPQWAATQRAGTAVAFGAGQQDLRSCTRQVTPRRARFLPPPPATGSAELRPQTRGFPALGYLPPLLHGLPSRAVGYRQRIQISRGLS